jgi:hypothetical protein
MPSFYTWLLPDWLFLANSFKSYINSNISHAYFLTKGKFVILIVALTTYLPFESNFISPSCIFLLELHILKVLNLTQKWFDHLC